MPEQPRPGQPKQYNLEWIHIDDFSPGCYDGSNISTEQPVITAPLGAADITQTFSCSSIVGGALGPLPGRSSTTAFSVVGGVPGSSPYALITAFIVTPQLNTANEFEVVVGYEGDDGTNHYVRFYSVSSLGAVNAITGPTSTSPTSAGFFGSPYPAFTRMNSGGTPGPPPPGPVLVFPSAVATDTTSGVPGHLWVYPTLSAPTTFVAQDLITGALGSRSSITGQTVTYGNRVICLAGVNYQWPVGGGINTNENFNYTDPPESATYLNQQTILAIETPWGYGAWGTVSVGELLLVKKYGGGVILNGDINTPSSVIRVPGIESTGDLVGSAYSTPIGLVYCSQNRGAWVWNGGNESTKISQNINDDFFDLQTNNITSNNYGFYVYHWQHMVLFSGNMLLDTRTNGWWKLFPGAGQGPGSIGFNIFWYSLAVNGNQICTGPLKVTSNTQSIISIFDNSLPSTFYQWQSLPIHVTKDADRVIDIRQVVIRASDPTATNVASVQLSVNFQVIGTSVTTIGIDPVPIRFNVGVEGVDDIIINVFANNPFGGSPASAPIIHSIDVGYQIRQAVSTDN